MSPMSIIQSTENLECKLWITAIQQNRDPIGYTKRTRRYPLVKPSSTSTDENSPGRTINETTAEQLVEVEQ